MYFIRLFHSFRISKLIVYNYTYLLGNNNVDILTERIETNNWSGTFEYWLL